MPSKLAVVGSANMDLVVRAPSIPRPGETLIGSSFAQFPGGKGANQAVAAARLKPPLLAPKAEGEGVGGEGQTRTNPSQSEPTQTFFIGKTGNDNFGTSLRSSLEVAGVDTSYLSYTTNTTPTGIALITVAESGQNSIVIDQGANGELTAEEVKAALESIKPNVVLVQLEIPDGAVEACAGDHTLILDPAPARYLDADFLRNVDVITPNETETADLTGIMPMDEFSCRRAAEALLNQGIKNVVITLGERGIYWTEGKTDRFFDAPQVVAVDTTAAGDAFAGALALFMCEGDDIQTAIEKAIKVASVSVTKHGAQASMPTREEVRL